MGNVIYSIQVSVDGYMQGPGRDISWHMVDEELHQFFNDEFRKAGAFLGGRITFELMADFWPTADEDLANPATMREFAAIWRNTPNIVYSTTLATAEWATRIVRSVVPEEVGALKQEFQGDLIVGGPVLASSFAAQDLIDEYWIFIHPVVLGEGTPIFDLPYSPQPIQFVDTRTFGNGVVRLRYRRP